MAKEIREKFTKQSLKITSQRMISKTPLKNLLNLLAG
jgi:hypothetical protein